MRSTVDISRLEALPCPICGDSLERGQGRQGLVWFCGNCRAGAITLPILRRFAPRPFVDQLWQAALHGSSPSALVCPACDQRFADIAGVGDATSSQIKVCVRCFWVWMDSEQLSSLSTPPARRALPPPAFPRDADDRAVRVRRRSTGRRIADR